MASEMSPGSPEQLREDGTQLRDTGGPEAGPPAEPNTGPDTHIAPAGKSHWLVIHTLLHNNCLLCLF